MICLVSDFRMLSQYVNQVPEMAYDILKYANKPTTIVYDHPIRVAENLVAADNSLAIRVVRDAFCGELIKRLKKPLVSTSANLSGQSTPAAFKDIEQTIIDGVDHVVNWKKDQVNKRASSIIKIKNDGTVKVIRS
jgi:L-threonylcarbamoyladenylate synthase